jgi:PAS domain S-box-containing protein/putative nucleotidyltransferase with HDIG domain
VKILYLEDNPNDALLTQRALNKATPPINVDIVHTLFDAFQRLENPPENYDLVLTDLNLPDGTGLNLLNRIRSLSLPYAVVVVTGQSDEDIAIAALKAGADDYISKNDEYLSRLPTTLQSAIERYHDEIARHSRSLHVLYAESNESDIEQTSQHMRKHAAHIQIEFVTSADQLFKILSSQNLRDHFDVILLDYLMPEINALDLLKNLNETRILDVPIVLITGHGSEDVVSQAVKLGASDYVVKNPGYLYKLPALIENSFHRTELIREQAALREAEARYRVLVEQSPVATYVDAIDDSSSTFYISNRIEEICGYPVSDWMNNKDFWFSIIHPGDIERVQEENFRTNQCFEPFQMEYRIIARDGRTIWVRDEAIIMLDKDGKPHHWQGVLLNITEKKLSDEGLRRRDAIMEAMSAAAENFLVASWRENIQSVLEHLGMAADVSRAYIFQNRLSHDDRIISDQIYEWAAPEIKAQIDNPSMTGFDFIKEGFSRWIPLMSQGQPVFGIVRNMGEGEKNIFSSQGILSIACMPIFVDQAWWGFIGFDECKGERDWSSAEIDALKTSANILGAAIQRLNAENALQRQLNELTVLQAVSSTAMKSTSIDELISTTTLTIGNLLYPDNCGVFLFDEVMNTLIRHPSYRGLDDNLPSKPIYPGKGIVGQVFENSTPLLIPNVKLAQDYISIHPDIMSEMAVPLRVGERAIGVLNVESLQLANYTLDDLRLLITIAGLLSVAMEKIRLLESEHRRLQESETLRQAAAVISTSLDLEIVLDTILSSVNKVVPYDSACIFLSENESSTLHIVAAQGFADNSAVLEMTFPEPSDLLKEVFNKRQIVIIDDLQKDNRYKKWGPEIDQIRGWMGVPLISRDEVMGYLTLDSLKPGAYSTSNAVLTQTFAYQAAAAISNASLYQETRSRLRELEVINRISSTLRSSITEEEMLPQLLRETLGALGTDSGSIWLYDRSTLHFSQTSSQGWFNQLPVTNVSREEGLISHILKSEQPYSISDFSEDEIISQKNRKSILDGWSGAGIPIRISSEMIGVLFVSVKHPRQLTKGELTLLATIAEMTGNAIHRAQLYSRSEQQVERLTALRDVDIAIGSSFDLKMTLDVIIDRVVNQLQVDAATILLFNPLTQTLDYSVGRGLRTSNKQNLHLRLGQSLAGKASLENTMVTITDIRESEVIPDHFRQEGFLSYFNVPLNAKGQIKGVLEVFMRQPYSPAADWLEFLSSLGGQTAIAIDNAQLFSNLQRSNIELELAYDTTLEGWGKALEIRDQETEGHTQRVTEMTLKLARRLGFEGEDLVQIRRGTLLHDIGKMGIPDEILRKPGTLTEQEWVIMRKHVEYAYTLLNPIDYLQKAMDIPYCHHERWNGSGYPRGLKGEEIPLPARIFAVIDVWDALLSDRPYRSAWVRDKVVDYILEQSGIQFDSKVVDVFMELVAAGEMD